MPKFAKDPSDLPPMSEILSMSGLEFMQRMLDGRLPAPPIAETLGYTLTSVSEGRVVFRGTPTFKTTNPMGTVHGGWYGTVLDSAMACAVMSRVPKGSVYTTLEFKVNILRPIPLNSSVDCIGEADHVGRSTGVAHASILGVDDEKLYATASTTCIVMRPDPA